MNDEELDAFLEHHGIKGMHWGIRNEERRRRNAQKFLDKASGIQGKIDQLNNTSIKRASAKGIVKAFKLKDLKEDKKRAIEDAQRKFEGKLSSKQKKVLIGAAVIGVALGAYGAYTMTQSGETRRLATKGSDFIKSKFSDPLDPGWKLDRSLADKMSVEDISSKVVSAINPGYGDTGTKVNCRRATFAYEMRRRGYDVAATKTTDGRGQNPIGLFNAVFSKDKDIVPQNRSNALAKIFSETKKEEKPFTSFLTEHAASIGEQKVKPQDIMDELFNQPSGARGELGVIWAGGGGHSMAWEIVKGDPVIFDTQTGRVYESLQDFKEISDSVVDAGITRLDNRPINTNFLMRWVRNNG